MISMREDDIPTFRVDLARPPELRYHEVAVAFGTRMRSMSAVFDELLQSMLGYRFLAKVAKFAAQLFLRRLYDNEQTKEVKAIARVARVDLYLLIALNVFLDILMGCTAGCVKARTTPSRGSTTGERPRLMHFRTLDWGMDALRDLLVVLEYVDSSTGSDRVIATTITYAGFVGTLTGVRQDLSISLNYRPTHLCTNWELRKHQSLVLLGFRPSISSIIHSTLLGYGRQAATTGHESRSPSSIVSEAKRIASLRSSPCYLTLCDGRQAAVVEKDLTDGRVKTATQYIVQTNHDSDHSACCGGGMKLQAAVLGNEIWRQDSTQRQDDMLNKLGDHLSTVTGHVRGREAFGDGNGTCVEQLVSVSNVPEMMPVPEETLREWMVDRTISTYFTHFACIMDPATGKICWLRRGPDARNEDKTT